VTQCTTLHHTEPHRTTLHHTAPHCTTMHRTAPHCIVTASEFSAQNTANTLWALATLGDTQSATLVTAMAARAEAMAQELAPQDVANTLWALATIDLGVPASVLQVRVCMCIRLYTCMCVYSCICIYLNMHVCLYI